MESNEKCYLVVEYPDGFSYNVDFDTVEDLLRRYDYVRKQVDPECKIRAYEIREIPLKATEPVMDHE